MTDTNNKRPAELQLDKETSNIEANDTSNSETKEKSNEPETWGRAPDEVLSQRRLVASTLHYISIIPACRILKATNSTMPKSETKPTGS